MMELYGKALMEERLKPRHHAEIERYMRWEYGPAVRPDFLFAAVADGAARRPGRSRPLAGLVRALGRVAMAIVPRSANSRRAKSIEAVK